MLFFRKFSVETLFRLSLRGFETSVEKKFPSIVGKFFPPKGGVEIKKPRHSEKTVLKYII
jgi:hypothetical protein